MMTSAQWMSRNVFLAFIAHRKMSFTLGEEALCTPKIWKHRPHIPSPPKVISFESDDYTVVPLWATFLTFFPILNSFLDEIFL